MSESGAIYLVATPIGNLEDITLRALRTLREVDLIAAEDTRQTLKLLNHFEIKKPLVSYHEHNQRESGAKLVEEAIGGKTIALVTDAGTPGISDPGEGIVRLAVERGVPVYLIPGAAALIYGLVVSGLPTARFVFEGFLPTDKKGKREKLLALQQEERTILFYEAPHKLERTLKDLLEHFGDRRVALCRELTKKYEEILRFTLSEAIVYFSEKKPMGEFVIVMEGLCAEKKAEALAEAYANLTIEEHIQKYIGEGLDKKEAIKAVAKERNLPKTEVYRHSY